MSRRLHCAGSLLALTAGCATAERANGDAHSADTPHAMMADALPDVGPRSVTLAQTTSGTVVQGNSFGCNQGTTHYTQDNSYYRVFSLAAAGITGTLHVQSVQFLVETATAGSGGQQPATVNLGAYTGTLDAVTLDTTKISSIGTMALQIPNGTGSTVVVPISADVPAMTDLSVELHVPDGTSTHNVFFFGSNGSGESHPAYLRATACSTTTPTTIASIAAANSLPPMDIILTVSGTW